MGWGHGSANGEAWLELVTPDGNYDLWNINNSARAMQDVSDEDFAVETRFLSTPDTGAQTQGILIESDANNWIRFDVYSDGTSLRAFAAVTLDGQSSARINVVIPEGSAEFIRVSRDGRVWTFEYSGDGETWVEAGNFSQELTVTSAGVFAGNSGAATGYTAQIDYFEISSDPLTTEDGVAYQSDFVDAPSPPSDPFSDDFSSLSLGGGWRIEGPSGVTSGLVSDGIDSWLELITPDGNFDLWNNNNAGRAMQDTPDEDFTLSTRFLSVPSERYQMQGILVEQDEANWIRFDTYSDGNVLRVFAAVTVNGASSVRISAALPTAAAPYLEVVRVGDEWTFRYSTDGATWVTAGSFTHALNVTATGVYAGNAAGATGFTAQVDYFETSLAPLGSEDGTVIGANTGPTAQDDAVAAMADTEVSINAADLLANDSDPENDTLVITGYTQPTNGTLTDNLDGTWTYTPGTGYVGDDTFTYSVSDGELTDSATVTVTVQAPSPPSDPFSDDFSSLSLGGGWRIEGPSGVTSGLVSDGIDSWLELITPDGNFDLWNNNNAGRAMQDTPDEDFTLSTRFLSVPSERYQMQGILVEQDEANWIRFDTYSDGNVLRVFAAVTVNGASSVRISAALPTAAAPYLEVVRVGDEWTFRYSTDGATWVTAGSFTHALNVTATGVYAGNAAGATGFTAQVDYFETSLAPLGSEDGSLMPVDAVDDSLVTDADVPLTFAVADLLYNDLEPDGTTLTVISVGSPQNGTLTDNQDGTWTYAPDAGYQGYDVFEYTVSDGITEDTAQVVLTVGTPPPPSFVSDDFHNSALGLQWQIVAPNGTSHSLGSEGQESFLSLSTGPGNHDIWNGNNAVRAMQDVSDEDFEIEARFLSVPTEAYQMQGFLIEGDESNWLRFDTYSDGSRLYAFAASTVEGSSSQLFRTVIPEGAAPYLRLDRTGDTFTFSYSTDGETWAVAGTATRSIVVTQTGVFGASVGAADGFSAIVDYVEATSDPVLTEDTFTFSYSTDGETWAVAGTATRSIVVTQTGVFGASVGAADGFSAIVDYVEATSDPVLTEDTFTFSYSTDGETWAVAGTATRSIVVTQTGVFGASVGAADGFSAIVDYVEATSDPVLTEDGITAPPNAVDDSFATAPDVPLTLSTAELIANDIEPDGDPMVIVSVTAPSNGTLTDNGDGTYTYTPAAGYEGYDGFAYTVSDGTSEDTATVTLTVGTPPPPELVADDFNGSTLSHNWQVVPKQGATFGLGGNADDAYLEIATTGGNFDLWGTTRNAPRAMQEITDEDFSYEVRFISTPSQAHQMQGFLIEEGAGTWLRYDMYSDGTRLYAFAALTVGGNSSVLLKTPIPETVEYLRLERNADLFTFSYSEDGDAWTVAGDAVIAMAPTQAGVFAGSVGADSGLTVQVDYVQSSETPLLDEDAGYEPAPAPPVTAPDNFSMDPDTFLEFTAADLLSNDYDINRDELVIVGFSGLENGTIDGLGGGNYVYMPAPSFEGIETFTYTVSDGSFTSEGQVSVLVDLFDAVSDDFSGDALSSVWTFEGISGAAYIGYDGVEAFAQIISPQGVQVSASGNLTTPRLMQDVLDLDFQIQAGFLTEPGLKYQEHGLLVVEDDGNWLRFDLAYTGNKLTLIVGNIDGNTTTYPLFSTVGSGAVEEFRITREGDLFTFEYRGDTSDWIVAHTLEREMTVTKVGVFAGSTSFDSDVPGYIAQIDYFQNSLDPIVDEDGSYVPQNHAPVASDDAFGVPDNLIFSYDDLLANDYDPDVGDTISVTSVGSVSHGTLTDNGDGTFLYVPDEGFQGLDSFAYTITDGTLTSQATATLDVQKPIDVWHGDVQSFGSPGEGQRWINILGNAADTVSSLAYSLNGGALVSLSMGPDTRRLQENGDFNIDIDYALLDPSATDDIVTIYATLANGAVFAQDVTIEYEGGGTWDPNYAIDWGSVADIQEVVQVVDGAWTWDENGARPVQLGYDRLLVLGDQSWDNYELNVVITAHDLQNVDPLGRDGGGLAIGMLWDGHTTGRFTGWQPASGYEPGASFFYTHLFKSHSYHTFSEVLGTTRSLSLEEGLSYNFTVRVEQIGLYDRLYSLKAWEVGTTEPVDWTLQTVETFSLDEAPATGSIYLNAHYFDVTFGDLTVTEITGDDIIQGDETDEVLMAVNVLDAAPGIGEIDVFVGSGGSDIFVFGDANGTYYDDTTASDEGLNDYGFVWDFEVGIDMVQLAGGPVDYVLTENHAGLTPGTAIWRVGQADESDELIGLLNDVTGLDLYGTSFIYEGQFA
ncbi:Regulation of enolase protein 1, concanavalin A-like superfamily [Roseivivax lentus]|uniref:Regulation of enolase protein 1, concanavalin A-like superfamily n=1 Tax=Roseivivax lentus TaxID=633194 RepID=A0A1N7Q255_9RHOB|nr:Regulation of enolase protein 1, concanavalin A-like superfamily [Roseivivax lentus]